MLLDVPSICRLHEDMVVRWHEREVDNVYSGPFQIICQQHGYNFQLWHEEDIARSKDVGDSRVAQVKRNIDRFNQQRNDWIERVDDWLTEEIGRRGIQPKSNAKQNTETSGMAIDRLSILSLRLFHLREQTARTDVDTQHLESVRRKIAVCLVQQEDLIRALTDLLADIESGDKVHKTYRQFKMYNDPTLNPYLYKSPATKAA